MESTYYNLLAPASYGGLNKFKAKGYSKKQIRECLQSQDTHTLHKPTRRRFPRRRAVHYRRPDLKKKWSETHILKTSPSCLSMERPKHIGITPLYMSTSTLNKFKAKGYSKKQIREWLQSQDTHTLHKPTRRRFPRRRAVVYGIDHQWQADFVNKYLNPLL
jgi:DNA-binding transcriptional MerR regulator